MNFTKSVIIFLLVIITFSIPVSAQIINGNFETGDFTGWNQTNAGFVNLGGLYGSYTASVPAYQTYVSSTLFQEYDNSLYSSITFDFTRFSWGRPHTIQIYDDANLIIQYGPSSETLPSSGTRTVNLSAYTGTGKILISGSALYHGSFPDGEYVRIDNVVLTDVPPTLMEFTNEPIEVTTYAHLECNLDEYWDTHANEHFYLSYDYYYKNISDYTIIDFNELELNAQNTVNLIPTYYPYFNQTGGCEIKASILYTYHDPIYTESPLGYITTVLVNSTYEPPEEPEEPEEPEIPDPESEPEPEPEPPIPPTQPNGTDANQSINVSWTGEYYNNVNNTIGGLCSPLYNFTNWSLSPVYSLNDSVGEFNYHMNESFTQTAQDSSILYDSINTIYGAIHPKIRNVITYYLIWIVLLIVLKRD